MLRPSDVPDLPPPTLLPCLAAFFQHEAPLAPGQALLVAFSGGPDSTALLLGLSRLAPRQGWRLSALHVDHGLDPGSAGRAAAAARIAAALGVPLAVERRDLPRLRRAGESPEAAARRVRYEALEEARRRVGARWTVTAHHRDDQAETVLLRLLFGSGLEGLAGVRPVQGAVVRPLLALPRTALREAVEAAGLEAVEDPTNRDLAVPRNRVRHLLLPSLEESDAGVASRLAGLAARTRTAMERLDLRLGAHLRGQPFEEAEGVAVDRAALAALPLEVLPFALSGLHRRAGAPYPAGGAARAELVRQIRGGGHVACDCGGGWRWEEDGERLALRRSRQKEKPIDFTYTLQIPGELEIPELAVRVSLSRRAVEPWMLEGSPHRAALALPLVEGDRVTVRNRRPGDRIYPLGGSGTRKLKEVLVDRRVPRREREKLPLICVDDRIAWVPGVTIDHRFRIAGEPATTAWIAEIVEITEVTTT
jgi:tRNA(Ile)-lysidine synthase